MMGILESYTNSQTACPFFNGDYYTSYSAQSLHVFFQEFKLLKVKQRTGGLGFYPNMYLHLHY